MKPGESLRHVLCIFNSGAFFVEVANVPSLSSSASSNVQNPRIQEAVVSVGTGVLAGTNLDSGACCGNLGRWFGGCCRLQSQAFSPCGFGQIIG